MTNQRLHCILTDLKEKLSNENPSSTTFFGIYNKTLDIRYELERGAKQSISVTHSINIDEIPNIGCNKDIVDEFYFDLQKKVSQKCDRVDTEYLLNVSKEVQSKLSAELGGIYITKVSATYEDDINGVTFTILVGDGKIYRNNSFSIMNIESIYNSHINWIIDRAKIEIIGKF